LVVTANAKLDWIGYVQTLRGNGVLCLVGAPPGLIQIPPALLVTQQRSICGSDIGDRATIGEMLRFAAAHRIAPVVETARLHAANARLTRGRETRFRYGMFIGCCPARAASARDSRRSRRTRRAACAAAPCRCACAESARRRAG